MAQEEYLHELVEVLEQEDKLEVGLVDNLVVQLVGTLEVELEDKLEDKQVAALEDN